MCSKKIILTGVGKGVGGDVGRGVLISGRNTGCNVTATGLGVGGGVGGLDVGGNVLGDIVGGFVCPSNVGLIGKRKQGMIHFSLWLEREQKHKYQKE